LLVPRLSARAGWGALAAGMCLLAALAATGAALAHLAEYHLGLGNPGGGWTGVGFMLAHCPVRGGLLLVGLIALCTLIAVGHELRALLREQRRLGLAARHYRVVAPSPVVRSATRCPARFAALFLPLLATQVGLYALAAHLWPMVGPMRMHGVWMYMALQGALPPLPLHLLVATALAALAWRLERRFVALDAAIAVVRRALAHALDMPRSAPLPPLPSIVPLSRYCGPATLSRPPPRRAG
jgi:hypothetical protein